MKDWNYSEALFRGARIETVSVDQIRAWAAEMREIYADSSYAPWTTQSANQAVGTGWIVGLWVWRPIFVGSAVLGPNDGSWIRAEQSARIGFGAR